MPRAYNKHADALATLASKVDILDETVDVNVMKEILRAATTNFILIYSFDEQDWRNSVIQNLNQPSTTVAMKDFMIVNIEVYHRGCRILA